MPVIPANRKVRQEDRKFKVSLGHLARPCFKKGWRYSSVAECLPNMCEAKVLQALQ